jgi:hypothetical protein
MPELLFADPNPISIARPSRPGPQFLPIKALHRHDGYITFIVKDDEGGDRLARRFAIRADALDTWFPQFTADLMRNSFCSINGGYTLANRNTTSPYGRALHNTDSLRYLCACYCDIDYYDRKLTRLQVIMELERMWESGELPQASMVVDSGKGMWLLWLLHDAEHPERAHLGAWTDNPNDHLLLYTRINKALHKLLDHIGADHIADGVRSIRVPGSFRNDTERFVKWSIHGDSDRAMSYTLKELAERLGVTLTPRSPSERAAIDSTSVSTGNRKNGWKQTNLNRLHAFVTIKDQRGGGFRDSCRHKAAFLYAMALRWVEGQDYREARCSLVEMGKCCEPPLSARECMEAWRQGYRTKRPKLAYRTMAEWLDVTPAEAEIVSQLLYGKCQAGDRRYFPAAPRFGAVEPVTSNTGEKTKRTKQYIRREEIGRIIAAAGRVLSVREMQVELLRQGIEGSIGTLHADYKTLNIQSAFADKRQQMSRQSSLDEEMVRAFFSTDSATPMDGSAPFDGLSSSQPLAE